MDQYANILFENRFWKRAGFVPLYLRQTQSELTGEHTCVMVRGLNSSAESDLEWLGEFAKGKSDFTNKDIDTTTLCGRFQTTLPLVTLFQVQRVWERDGVEPPRGRQCGSQERWRDG